eukprot:CAMPEP_0115012094 /NCGR_PEP_ID=MMETSP0216-20121206/24495_1 /TAXON_ID=223996 /ORGANISM="Protocruzia adherens, Strain Boccale" /LENGTH=235 /DNA_ID=CAMNT_0002381011 /DNA_START=178 /DNA_END=885 /DNA_ORIENTATION=+
MKKFIVLNQAKAVHLVPNSRYKQEKFDFSNPLHRLSARAAASQGFQAQELDRAQEHSGKNFDVKAKEFNYIKASTEAQASKKQTEHAKVAQTNAANLFEDGEGRHNYKTLLCRNWWNGRCRYGDKCAFAHGTHELRVAIKNPFNYKTEQCRLHETFKWCPYSYRCQFKHDDEGNCTSDSKSNSTKKLKVRSEIKDYKVAILEPTNYINLTFEENELDAQHPNRLECFKAIPLESE